MSDSEGRYRRTLDSLLEGFQILSPDWRYVYVNPAAARHGRKSPQELEGRTMPEVYPGIEQTPMFATLQRCMSERVPASMENLFAFSDSESHWFELRVEPVPEGLCIHSVDIDDRKRAEQALRHLNEELEARVSLRTRELENANKELEAFAYSVSHDLRGPLRSIDGFSRALVDDCLPQLGADGQGHLQRILAAVRRMEQLIGDMLNLSRITRATLKPSDVDLTDLAREVTKRLAERDPRRPITCEIAPDLRASCDPALARIALENVLENAWKFTGQTPSAHVSVQRSTEDPGAIVIADNGAGFDMAFAERLGTPFQRFHTEREFPGTGVGLATVKRIMQKHGGSLRVVGAVGAGATVTLHFGSADPPPAQ